MKKLLKGDDEYEWLINQMISWIEVTDEDTGRFFPSTGSEEVN